MFSNALWKEKWEPVFGQGHAQRASQASAAVLVPTRPVPAAPAILRIEALTAEAQPERVGVRLLGEAKYLPPLVFVVDAMAARTQRQVATERMQRSKVRSPTQVRAQGDLMGPSAVYCGR
jgi:hypothetical protein